MEIKFIDMFCGIGGFRLGFERANNHQEDERQSQGKEAITRTQDSSLNRNIGSASFTCVWSNDNDKYACQIYRKHFGEVCEGDIQAVGTNAIPEHDLLCAGFPCQSFSIAGKRRGFEDTRGTLFFEICRVLESKRTPYVLLENVKGLLSHDEGQTFLTILESLDELGYDCQWQVLNSKDFGVPQNRERVFIVGHLRGKPRPKVFPIGEASEGFNERTDATASVRALSGGGHSGGHHSGMTILLDPIHMRDEALRTYEERCPTLSGRDYKEPKIILHNIYGGFKETKPRVFEDISPAIRTPKGGGHIPSVVRPVLTPDREKKRQHGRRMKENEEPMFTLTGQDIHGVMMGTLTEALGTRQGSSKEFLRSVEKLGGIRRLTPTECERLQGFPDGWTENGLTQEGELVKISDSQRYKCNGNAVYPEIIRLIGLRLREAFT